MRSGFCIDSSVNAASTAMNRPSSPPMIELSSGCGRDGTVGTAAAVRMLTFDWRDWLSRLVSV